MIVTLLSDFGRADYFVGAMKGVLLTAAPEVTLVDLSHEIPPHDVAAGAFTLLAVHREFPPGTVHLAVVDPGVGSERSGLVVECAGHRFVGPDNGLFSYVLERADRWRAFRIDTGRAARGVVSATFHGRDVFAPVAARLAAGLDAQEVGPEALDIERLGGLRPQRRGDAWWGTILHVDRFGNCVTNLSPAELPEELAGGDWRIEAGGGTVRRLRPFYADAGDDDEPFAVWGSAGFLELAVNRGSAARRLGVGRGDRLVLRPG